MRIIAFDNVYECFVDATSVRQCMFTLFWFCFHMPFVAFYLFHCALFAATTICERWFEIIFAAFYALYCFCFPSHGFHECWFGAVVEFSNVMDCEILKFGNVSIFNEMQDESNASTRAIAKLFAFARQTKNPV